MALLPLAEMGTAPHIVTGYDMLQPVIQFSHWHVYSDSCSCLIEQHSRTMAVIRQSCACKHTDCHCIVLFEYSSRGQIPIIMGPT